MRSSYNYHISTIPSRLHHIGICRLPSHQSFGLAPRVHVITSYESSRDYMQRVITYSVSELFADDYKWALPATRQAFQFATLHITSFFLTFLLPFLLTSSPSSPLPSPQQQQQHHPHHHTITPLVQWHHNLSLRAIHSQTSLTGTSGSSSLAPASIACTAVCSKTHLQ